MPAETSVSYEALQAQANAITELFNERGYELVAPAYLQPADLFLDLLDQRFFLGIEQPVVVGTINTGHTIKRLLPYLT